MLHKNLATVRVSNIHPQCQKSELLHFFEQSKARAASTASLCPSTPRKNASLTATVTFRSSSDAKQALRLNAQLLRDQAFVVDEHFMGLTVLAVPQEPTVDIIAVHGLNGHAFGTWACHDDNKSSADTMWLRDFLTDKIQGARIMTYGYNSALIGPSTSVSNVEDFAYDLLQRILDDRRTDEHSRPLVFICHSLGGIIVKQAIVFAHSDPDRYRLIHRAIKSVLFFATPHRGSKSANLGSLLSSVASMTLQRPSKQLLETLKHQSPLLLQLSEAFGAVSSSLKLVNFYERRKTPILNSLIVDEFSSRIGVENEILLPLDATHRDICRFQAPTDALFSLVVAQIARCTDFDSEELKKQTATDREPLAQPSKAKTKPLSTRKRHFFVPVLPNPNFCGREKELVMIESHLQSLRENVRYSCPIVAVHGLGGVGKTQLVTEYLYQQKAKWPSMSMFWISARSKDDIQLGLQQISRKLSLTRDLAGRVCQSEQYRHTDFAAQFADINEDLALLKEWMASSDHEEWLLVLDNYDNVQLDIRDSLPTEGAGSILVTSRDRRIIGSIARSGFGLFQMGLEEAKQLFLRVIGSNFECRKQDCPSFHAGDENLDNLMQELQCFPLAIDQAASFLRENSPMTLAEYLDLLKPRSTDRARLMGFKEANPAYPESVMTTWEISLHHLQKTQPSASQILQILGFLDHSYVAEDLLTATNKGRPWIFNVKSELRLPPSNFHGDLRYLVNNVDFRRSIGTLTSLSLIQRNPALKTLSVHPLVHEWIRVRLQANPETQARLTVAAILILYQSFPIEMVAWLPLEPFGMSTEDCQSINQVSHHLRTVLVNVKDYYSHAVNVPLECFNLLEGIYLTGISQHRIYALDLPDDLYGELSAIIPLLISKLDPKSQPLAFFVHKVTISLHRKSRLDLSVKIPRKIAMSLESLKIALPLEDAVTTLVLLLATTIIDVSDSVIETSLPEMTVFEQNEHLQISGYLGVLDIKDAYGKVDSLRDCKVRLLTGLHTLLTPLYHTSRLMRWIGLMVEIRLVTILTPAEFRMRDGLGIDRNLSIKTLDCLNAEDRGKHLDNLLLLCWSDSWPRDYPRLQRLYAIAFAEGNASIVKQKHQIKEEEDTELISQSSRQYISSSFGRYGEIGSKHALSLIVPLRFLNTFTPKVAEAISDPALNWILDSKSGQETVKLNIEQRKWALTLLTDWQRLCKKVRLLQRVEFDALMHVGKIDITFVRLRIMENLERWSQVQVDLWKALQCRAILDWHDLNSINLPLEGSDNDIQSTSKEKNLGGVVLPDTASTENSPATCSLSLSHDDLCQRLGNMPVSGTEETELSLARVRNGWVSRLERMANKRSTSQEMADESRTSQETANKGRTIQRETNFDSVHQHAASSRRERVTPKNFGIPGHCNCVARKDVHKGISVFISLCEHKKAISRAEASETITKLQSLQSAKSLGAKYLGRLEIINRLSKALLANTVRANATQLEEQPGEQLLESTRGGDSLESFESSDGNSSEGPEDIFSMDLDSDEEHST